MIERRTGRSFRRLVRAELLEPAGLEATGWFGEPVAPGLRFPRGYRRRRDRGTPPAWRLTWALLGGGGMVSTVDDLWRWYRSLQDGELLAAAGSAALFRPRRERWSLGGWDVRGDERGRRIQKGGSGDHGFTALVRDRPDSGWTMVLLFNSYAADADGRTHYLAAERIEAALFAAAGTE